MKLILLLGCYLLGEGLQKIKNILNDIKEFQLCRMFI